MRLVYLCSLLLLWGWGSTVGAAALPDVSGVTGGWVNERSIDHVLHVSMDGDDGNPGTVELPLLTINEAADMAGQYQQAGQSTKIVICPGVYRETVDALMNYPVDGSIGAAIIFEPCEPGSVTVSASEVYANWQAEGGDVYSHAWAYDWGLWVDPPAGGAQYEKDIFLDNPILRRREMFFVDGVKLTQVLDYNTLLQQENAFFVDEAGDRVYLRLPGGTDINSVTVEAAERMYIFRTYRNRSIVVRGLIFEHATNVIFGNGAVHFEESEDIVFEDNEVRWCNGNGWVFQGNSYDSGGGPLHYYPCERITARRNIANNNGIAGAKTHLTRNTLFEDNITSNNNWRGVRAGLTWGWTGTRFYLMHDAIIRRHTSIGNHARGIWFDTDADNILLADCDLSENVDGLKFEVCQGPILVENCTINNNSRSGILFHVDRDITVRDCEITGNALYQLEVSSSQVSKYLTDWYLERPAGDLPAGDLAFEHNVVGGTATADLVYIPDYDPFLTTFLAASNYYYHAGNTDVFRVQSARLDLSAWRAFTGQDLDSSFSTAPPSAAYCGDWGTVYDLGDVDHDCMVDLDDFVELAGNWDTDLADTTVTRQYVIEPKLDTTFDSQVWPYTSDGGTATALTNYVWNGGSNEKRCSLMMFDVGGIDASATVQIDQAVLFIRANDYRHSGDPDVSGRVHGWALHRMLVPWSEADTYGALAGLRAGVEYDVNPFATYVHDGDEGPGDKFISGLETAVSNWLDGTWTNHGFIILSYLPSGGTSFNVVTFRSREFIAYPNENPLLMITATARPTCNEIVGQVAADINGDCFIDLEDISVVAADWLNATAP